jgi:hypothetical protein
MFMLFYNDMYEVDNTGDDDEPRESHPTSITFL